MTLLAASSLSCRAISQRATPDAGVSSAYRVTLGFDSVALRVVLPLQAGAAADVPAWFVLLETSDAEDARRRGILHVPRLAELRGTAAVQRGRFEGDRLLVESGVDFAPERRVVAGAADAFPPSSAAPGAVGRDGYSPFVEFPDGIVRNVPLVADAAGQADRVTLINRVQGWVSMRVTRGYASGRTVWYVSTDVSDPMVAAIEGATYAPAIAKASAGVGSADLVAFVNGPRTAEDAAERHGMQSAMAAEGDPLNILAALPTEAGYAPLWNLQMAMWSPRAVADRQRERLLGLNEVRARIADGLAAGMGPNGALANTGALVNCPVVAWR
jgi:hypothetical protein